MAGVTLRNAYGAEVTVSAEAAEGLVKAGGWTKTTSAAPRKTEPKPSSASKTTSKTTNNSSK